ncbi:MAG TPA: hypothetical protein VG755_39305 [Nannocystaceae bacterium]|nr:hypothetical protein [Nannocystaceae bacterium]
MNLAEIPDGQIVIARIGEIYPDDESTFPLGYRRVLGLARLAQTLERELKLEHDLAVLVAATLVAPIASA